MSSKSGAFIDKKRFPHYNTLNNSWISLFMKKSRKQFIRHLIISTLGALLLYLIKGFIICYECFNSGPDFNGSPAGVVMDLLILPLSPFLAIYNFPVSLGIFNASTHPFHAFPEWLWWTSFISTQILYIYIVDRLLLNKRLPDNVSTR